MLTLVEGWADTSAWQRGAEGGRSILIYNNGTLAGGLYTVYRPRAEWRVWMRSLAPTYDLRSGVITGTGRKEYQHFDFKRDPLEVAQIAYVAATLDG